MSEYEAVNTLLTVCSNCKKEENILIVTDPTSYEVAKAMWDGMSAFPNKSIIIMDEKTMHGEEPNKMVAEAMLHSDVIFGCTKFSLFHSPARRNAVANGARFVNMADYSINMLKSGGLYCDFLKTGEKCTRMAELLRDGKTIHITTDAGTNFECSIVGRAPVPQYARSLGPGESSSPPDIECASCALENTGNGTIVIDGSIPHPLLGLINDPIKLTIKESKIVKIEGGEQAEKLRQLMENLSDPNVYNVGELGFGLNDMCSLNGRMLEDEGCGHTMHIGCGDNRGFGGVVASSYHLDMVFKKPTVLCDGKMIYKEGEVC